MSTVAVRPEDIIQRIEGMRPRLIATARRLGHSASDAEDLVQDAFTAAVRGLERFRGDASIETWVYQIFLRKHVDVFRRKPRPLPKHRPEPADPVKQVLQKERHEAVRKSLSKIPENLQMLIIMRFIEERPYSEIAEIWDVPIGTLRRWVFEALNRIRASLEELV